MYLLPLQKTAAITENGVKAVKAKGCGRMRKEVSDITGTEVIASSTCNLGFNNVNYQNGVPILLLNAFSSVSGQFSLKIL